MLVFGQFNHRLARKITDCLVLPVLGLGPSNSRTFSTCSSCCGNRDRLWPSTLLRRSLKVFRKPFAVVLDFNRNRVRRDKREASIEASTRNLSDDVSHAHRKSQLSAHPFERKFDGSVRLRRERSQ